MTKVVFFMLLSAAAAPSVRAGDTKDSLRDVMDICNQFIFNDPDPGIRLDYHNDCDITTTGMPPLGSKPRRAPGDPVFQPSVSARALIRIDH
jgi:hypothetical protein